MSCMRFLIQGNSGLTRWEFRLVLSIFGSSFIVGITHVRISAVLALCRRGTTGAIASLSLFVTLDSLST